MVIAIKHRPRATKQLMIDWLISRLVSDVGYYSTDTGGDGSYEPSNDPIRSTFSEGSPQCTTSDRPAMGDVVVRVHGLPQSTSLVSN